jgi:hypothetical protein
VREMRGGLYRVSLGWLWPSRKVSRSYMPLCPGEILLARAMSGCIKMGVSLTFPYFPNREFIFGFGLVSRDPLRNGGRGGLAGAMAPPPHNFL